MLSVVVPGYNTSATDWSRCVESILRNLSSEDEVICVDDCSQEYPEVLDRLAQRDSRIKVVRQKSNCGQAVARNEGLAKATGEYVAFVDSDDAVGLGNLYEECIRCMVQTGADIAVYGFKTIWVRENLEKQDIPEGTWVGPLNASRLQRLYDENVFNVPWNKVYRKGFLLENQIRFSEKAIPREDEVFNLDCVAHQAVWVEVPLCGQLYFRQDGTSLARYRRYNRESNELVNEAWERVRRGLGGSNALVRTGELDEIGLAWSDWRNIWRRQTPYSLADRWRWLSDRVEFRRRSRLVVFFRMMVFSFLRRYCYFRWVRRWNVKRLNPHVREVQG